MTTYEEYRQLRRDIGFPEETAIFESVWNGCELDMQRSMVDQLRPAAEQARARRDAYGCDHW